MMLDVSFWDNTAWSHVHKHSISVQCMKITHTHTTIHISQRNHREYLKRNNDSQCDCLKTFNEDSDRHWSFWSFISVENDWQFLEINSKLSHFSWQPLWMGKLESCHPKKVPTIWVSSNLILSLPLLHTLTHDLPPAAWYLFVHQVLAFGPPSVGVLVLVKPGKVSLPGVQSDRNQGEILLVLLFLPYQMKGG